MSIVSALNVYDVNSNKIRIGNRNDGGYILNDLIINNTKRLICVGIGNEESFELEWAEKFPNCCIEAYDGTYPCNNLCHKFPDRINKNIFYVNHNIGYLDKQIPLNIIADTKTDVLLKVDIEGGEYSVFDNFYPTDNIVGLILEIHDTHLIENREKITKLITQNFNHLMLFHLHGNAWGGTYDLEFSSGSCPPIVFKNFPYVIELSFVSKRLVKQYKISEEKFPIKNLDYSNKPDSDDIDLDWINTL